MPPKPCAARVLRRFTVTKRCCCRAESGFFRGPQNLFSVHQSKVLKAEVHAERFGDGFCDVIGMAENIPDAVEFYHRSGFADTDVEQLRNGMRYAPMVFIK